MRGLVSAFNLFATGIAYIVNLAASAAIVDPHLVWDFGAPAILGAIVTVFFYFNFRHIDKEEYVLSTNQIGEHEPIEGIGAGNSKDNVQSKV
ncbi:peptide transporter ptr2 [Purpureocillium takamizusanense]|uniref:Peptide transporter ptr2 n=1 Tax=Purpureocillium takamizusanense TaxID=2060973 RepID=A0A9Q8QG98_9HYPO|nr:peptide transporter ptr2 [Purpureocillium takamizusanense]UNI18344.1 peptide transporter ptr2 [Purpureocillium takamizusanense]